MAVKVKMHPEIQKEAIKETMQEVELRAFSSVCQYSTITRQQS